MNTRDKVFILFVSVLLSFYILSLVNATEETKLKLKWTTLLDDEISAIKIKNLKWKDNSSEKEIIVSAGKKVYVLDSNGTILKEIPVDSKGKIYAIDFLDIDNDGTYEIIAGSGWMENKRVNKSYINQTPGEFILQRKVENKGRIDVIDYNKGVVVNSRDVPLFVKSIFVDSLLVNENKTIVIGGGGTDTYYYEIWGSESIGEIKCEDFDLEYNATFYRSPPVGYDCEPFFIEGRICYTECIPSLFLSSTTTTTTTTVVTTTTTSSTTTAPVIPSDICDERCTNISKISGVCRSSSCPDSESYIGTLGCPEEFKCCCSNPASITTTTDRLAQNLSVTFTENSVTAGKVLFLNKYLNITNEYKTEGIIWDVYVYNLYNDMDKEVIVAGDDKIFVLDYNLSSIIWALPLADKASSKDVIVANIGKENNLQIAASVFPQFDAPSLYLLDAGGNAKWQYRVPLKERFSELSFGDIDSDGENELLFVTDKNIYSLKEDGSLETKFSLFGTSALAIGNINDNKFKDLVLSSKNRLMMYEFSGAGSKVSDADFWFNKAKNFIGNLSQAVTYAEKAKKIYIKYNNTLNVQKTEKLILEIEKKILKKEKLRGDSLYTRAISDFAFENYKKSRELTKEARDIYLKINDSDGIKRCDNLLKQIEIFFGPDPALIKTTTTNESHVNETTTEMKLTTTTLDAKITSTTFQEGKNKSFFDDPTSYIIILLVAILIITFVFLIFRREKLKRRKEEKRSQSEVKKETESF